jgi:nitrate reductase NapE component
VKLRIENVKSMGEKVAAEEAALLAIVIVAAIGFVGVFGYIFYLTPGPNDNI